MQSDNNFFTNNTQGSKDSTKPGSLRRNANEHRDLSRLEGETADATELPGTLRRNANEHRNLSKLSGNTADATELPEENEIEKRSSSCCIS